MALPSPTTAKRLLGTGLCGAALALAACQPAPQPSGATALMDGTWVATFTLAKGSAECTLAGQYPAAIQRGVATIPLGTGALTGSVMPDATITMVMSSGAAAMRASGKFDVTSFDGRARTAGCDYRLTMDRQ